MFECPALGTGCLYNSLVLQQVIVCRPSGEAVGPGAGEPRVLLQLPAPGQLLPPRHTGHSGTVEDDISLLLGTTILLIEFCTSELFAK